MSDLWGHVRDDATSRGIIAQADLRGQIPLSQAGELCRKYEQHWIIVELLFGVGAADTSDTAEWLAKTPPRVPPQARRP